MKRDHAIKTAGTACTVEMGDRSRQWNRRTDAGADSWDTQPGGVNLLRRRRMELESLWYEIGRAHV